MKLPVWVSALPFHYKVGYFPCPGWNCAAPQFPVHCSRVPEQVSDLIENFCHDIIWFKTMKWWEPWFPMPYLGLKWVAAEDWSRKSTLLSPAMWSILEEGNPDMGHWSTYKYLTHSFLLLRDANVIKAEYEDNLLIDIIIYETGNLDSSFQMQLQCSS